MSDPERIASILAEWQEKRDQGEDVDEEAIFAAHPDLADKLREKFAGLRMIDATRVGTRASPSATRLRELPLDRYSDFRPAGEGGMGIVYWAIDTDLNREVAFKVIRSGLGEGDTTTPEAPVELTAPAKDTPASQAFETLKQRFLQEAWVTGGLSHPGIVPVYELGETPEGVPYYTMRFIRGERTLADAIEEARAEDIEERLKLLEPFLKVCDTLSYAHAKGVIHRDLKPDNIALGEFGEVVVIDWGLAKIQDRPDVAQERWQDRIDAYRKATDLRTVASAMGTPGYMAPEAAKGQADQMDARSDVYSLGAILFQILTGRLPFEFTTFGEFVMKLLKEEPAKAVDVVAGVPLALSELCARCLASAADERPQDADEVAQAIRAWQSRSAVDREVEGLLRDATASLEAAKKREGEARIEELDRVVAACSRVLTLRPDQAQARDLQAEVVGLREQGIQERERSTRRRVLIRTGGAAVVLAAIAAVLFSLRLQAEQRATKRALTEAQLGGLLSASAEAARQDDSLCLLLAWEAAQLARTPQTLTRLHAAVTGATHVTTYPGHSDKIDRILVSPDGTRFLSVSRDGTARLWLLPGRMLALIEGMSTDYQPEDAAFSPTGDRIATAHTDGTARVWDREGKALTVLHHPDRGRLTSGVSLETGEEVTARAGHAVWSVQFSPDGRFLLTRTSDHLVRIWDLESREDQVIYEPAEDEWVTQASFSGTGSHVLIVSDPGATHLYEVATAQRVTFPRSIGHECALLSPSGSEVLVREDDDQTRLYSLAGKELAVFAGSELAAFSPDGSRLTTGQGDSICIYEPEGKMLYQVSLEDDPIEGPHIAVFARSNELLALSDGDAVSVYEGAFRRASLKPDTAQDSFEHVAFTPDSRCLVTLANKGTVRLWTTGGRLVRTIGGGRTWIHATALLPDRDQIITDSSDGTLFLSRLFEAQLGVIRPRRPTLRGLAGHSQPRLSFSPQGDALLVSVGSVSVEPPRLVDLQGEQLAEYGEGVSTHSSARFGPTGTRVLQFLPGPAVTGEAVLWSRNGDRIQQWGSRGQQLPGSRGDGLRRVELSPDGHGVLCIWTNSVLLHREPRGPAAILNLDGVPWGGMFSRDGRAVLTTSSNGAQIWNMQGEEVHRIPRREGDSVVISHLVDESHYVLRGHHEVALRQMSGDETVIARVPNSRVEYVMPSPSLDRYAIVCADGSVRLFDGAGAGLVASLASTQGEGEYEVGVQWSADGSCLLTVGRALRLWDRAGRLLVEMPLPEDTVSVALSPSGDTVATMNSSGWTYLWTLDAQELLTLAEERLARGFTPEERREYRVLLGDRGEATQSSASEHSD